jgi:hypothetical protein
MATAIGVVSAVSALGLVVTAGVLVARRRRLPAVDAA